MPAQPLHRRRIDLDEALADADQGLTLWLRSRRHQGVPLFSGGLLDSWPAWAVDALGICRQEEERVMAYVTSKAVPRE